MVIEGKQVKEWVARAYNNAVKHGWHEEKKPTAHWVMMISTEVTEAVQADRKGRWMDELDKSGLDCVIANDHHGGLLEKFYGEHIMLTVKSLVSQSSTFSSSVVYSVLHFTFFNPIRSNKRMQMSANSLSTVPSICSP